MHSDACDVEGSCSAFVLPRSHLHGGGVGGGTAACHEIRADQAWLAVAAKLTTRWLRCYSAQGGCRVGASVATCSSSQYLVSRRQRRSMPVRHHGLPAISKHAMSHGRCSVGMACTDDMSAFGSVRAIVVSAPAMAHRAGWSGCMRLCKPSCCRVCSLDVCRVDRHHESISITSHIIRLNGVKTRYTVPIKSLHGPLYHRSAVAVEVMPPCARGRSHASCAECAELQS